MYNRQYQKCISYIQFLSIYKYTIYIHIFLSIDQHVSSFKKINKQNKINLEEVVKRFNNREGKIHSVAFWIYIIYRVGENIILVRPKGEIIFDPFRCFYCNIGLFSIASCTFNFHYQNSLLHFRCQFFASFLDCSLSYFWKRQRCAYIYFSKCL